MPQDNIHHNKDRYKASNERRGIKGESFNKCRAVFDEARKNFQKSVEHNFLKTVEEVIGASKKGKRSANINLSSFTSDMREALIQRFKDEGFVCDWKMESDQRNGAYASSSEIIVKGWS